MGVSATENPKCPISWPSICGMPHLCPRFPSLQPTNLSPQQVRKGSPAQAGVLGTGSQPFALRMADRELKSTSLVRAALESDRQLVGHRGRGRPSSKLTLFNQRNHERQKAQEVGLRATPAPVLRRLCHLSHLLTSLPRRTAGSWPIHQSHNIY